MLNRRILKEYEHLVFLALDLGLNGFNYFFHIFVAWYLLPKDYGTLNSLLSFASILFVAGISIQLLASKIIANENASINFETLKIFAIKMFPLSVFFLFLLIPLLSTWTRGSTISVILVILIYFTNIYLCLFRGVFQGENRFLLINYSMYIEVLGKMLFLFIFLPRFKNIEIILLSVLLGMLSSLFLALYFNKSRLNNRGLKKGTLKDVGREFIVIAFSNVFLFYFTSIDMIFVNQSSTMNGGIYAVVLRLCQLITFGYFSIFTLLNPWMSSKASDMKGLKKSLKKYLALFSILNILILLVYNFLIPVLVPYLFGVKYFEAKTYIPFEGLAYVLLAMTFFSVNVFIQLSKKSHLVVLSLGAILLLLFYIFFSKTIMIMIIVQIIIYSLMLLVLSLILINHIRRF